MNRRQRALRYYKVFISNFLELIFLRRDSGERVTNSAQLFVPVIRIDWGVLSQSSIANVFPWLIMIRNIIHSDIFDKKTFS